MTAITHRVCSNCGGSGRVVGGHLRCEVCKGSGKIPLVTDVQGPKTEYRFCNCTDTTSNPCNVCHKPKEPSLEPRFMPHETEALASYLANDAYVPRPQDRDIIRRAGEALLASVQRDRRHREADYPGQMGIIEERLEAAEAENEELKKHITYVEEMATSNNRQSAVMLTEKDAEILQLRVDALKVIDYYMERFDQEISSEFPPQGVRFATDRIRRGK